MLAASCTAWLTACGHGADGRYDTMRRDYRALSAPSPTARREAEQAVTGAVLERSALVRAVLARNPSAEAARQAWRATLARYRQAGSYDDPMLALATAPLSIVSSDVPFGGQVGLSQRIPLGGKLDAQAAIAAAEAEAAQGDYESVRLGLALAASQLYDDLFVVDRALEINAEHTALVTTLRQGVLASYEAGRAAVYDTLQADVELVQLEDERLTLSAQRATVVARINALLHREPDAKLPAPPATLPPAPAIDATSALAREAVERRPEIAAARARTRATRARADAADSDYYPDLTVSTSYSSMWRMPEHRWMIGIELPLPLQRGRRNGAVEEATALGGMARANVESAADEVRAEVAIALQRLHEAQQSALLYETRLVPIARERIEAVRASFVAAHASFDTLIEAERGLRSAELGMRVAVATVHKRLAELQRAVGRTPGIDHEGGTP